MSNMLRSLRQRLGVAAMLFAVFASACSDATAPTVGTLSLTVQTSGGDLDIDGYQLVVDSARARYVSTSGAAIQPDGSQHVELSVVGLAPGIHSVSLKDVADNCSVSGPNPRSVTIAAGETNSLGFSVVCAATGIQVTTHTTGVDQPFGYDLRVDANFTRIATNGTQTVSRLEAGRPHAISLETTTGNCTVQGGVQTVAVPNRTIVPVRFEVSCAPVVRLEKIAYVVDTTIGASAMRMIGLVKPDDSGAKAVTTGDSPSWSPDGKRLVLTEASCSYYAPYYGLSCDGGLVVFDPEIGTRSALADASGGFGPAWSPTGDAIAFTRCCVYADRNIIYLLSPDGSLLKQLAVPQVANVSHPGWSPDGKRLAFTCSSATSALCVIDKTGDGFVQFSIGDASMGEGRPAWSPDGKRIAFTQYPRRSARPAIVLLDLASGVITRVTDGSQPSWSRDGSRLVFGGVDISGLFTINVDGSDARQLTVGAHSAPVWRP